MSLGALLTGDAPIVWRLTFGTAGIAGMIAVVIASRGITDPTGAIAAIGRFEWIAFPLYLVLTIVAFNPDLVRANTNLAPLQVEGTIMTLLVFLGIVFAWLLFTEPHPAGSGPRDLTVDAAPATHEAGVGRRPACGRVS